MIVCTYVHIYAWMYVCVCIYLFSYSFINLSNSQARYEVIMAVVVKTPCSLMFCCVSVDQNFSVFMLLLQGVQPAALLTPCCGSPLYNRLPTAVAEFAFVFLLKEIRIFGKPATCTSPCLSTKLKWTAHVFFWSCGPTLKKKRTVRAYFTLKKKAAVSSESSLNFNLTTRHHTLYDWCILDVTSN